LPIVVRPIASCGPGRTTIASCGPGRTTTCQLWS
jgi:hypothetical protein